MTKHELRTKWIAALRSGKYKQNMNGRLVSQDGQSHCCLGVLCEVYHQEYPEHQRTFGSGDCFPPENIVKAVGLVDYAGRFEDHRKEFDHLYCEVPESTLAYINDHGATFAQIATVIEKHKEIFKD